MKILGYLIVSLLLLGIGFAYADAPIVDLSQQDNGTEQNVEATQGSYQDEGNYPPSSSYSLQQRVDRLQQQIQNFVDMNLPEKIDDMQQQLQQLQGELQVQQHELKIFNEQQKAFYQDLNQRLSHLKTLTGDNVQTTVRSQKSSTLDAKELDSYKTAFEFIRTKRYKKAITALKQFVKQYPKGTYTANAHYWLGEVYYLQGEKDLAGQEMEAVINDYPTNNKVPDAMLKYAYVLQSRGESAQAKKQLQTLMKKFPNTSAARLAELRLKSAG